MFSKLESVKIGAKGNGLIEHSLKTLITNQVSRCTFYLKKRLSKFDSLRIVICEKYLLWRI